MAIGSFFIGLMLFASGSQPVPYLRRRHGAARRDRPGAAAPAPEHDDPPADALLGLRGLDRPLRLRDRRPDHPPRRRRMAARDPPLRPDRLDLPSASACCSAPAGPTAELGWGGYWAWDPVENAALMPFLLGTAFLHSIMVQEKRGMLKVWNASLIVATYLHVPARHLPGPLRRARSRSTPSATTPSVPTCSS